ncbi:MAG: hypothetical protein GXC72_07160 [Chitinophagaceae bacterium]|jgi:hypothetical protein|nr:hypothetical protein [Chitinophagaceae bacterium]
MIQKTIYKTKDYCKVKFNLSHATASSAAVLGLQGDWTSPLTMKQKKDGSFTAEVQLPRNSSHEFRYFINNSEWINDPEADGEVSNVYGTTNSLLAL